MSMSEVKLIGTYHPYSEPPSLAGYYVVMFPWGGPYLCTYEGGKWTHGANLTHQSARECMRVADSNFTGGIFMSSSQASDLRWCEVDLGIVLELFDL